MHNATERQIIKNQFTVDYKCHHDKNTMDAALIEQFHSMLDPKFAKNLRENMVATANPTFIATFAKAIRK